MGYLLSLPTQKEEAAGAISPTPSVDAIEIIYGRLPHGRETMKGKLICQITNLYAMEAKKDDLASLYNNYYSL